MGLKIYEVVPTSIPETQQELDSLRQRKIEEGTWGNDEIMSPRMPILGYMRIKSAVRQSTEEKEWSLKFCPFDMHGKIELPLIYEGYIDYIETEKEDFLSVSSPIWHIMTKHMLDVILSMVNHATSYPVAIFEREIINDLEIKIYKEEHRDITDEDIDKLIQEFRSNAIVRYYMLHLLEKYEIFDKDKSNNSENKYVFLKDLPNLPPFFRVAWGPVSALLCTEEGKKKLEDAQLLGLGFEELEIIEDSE